MVHTQPDFFDPVFVDGDIDTSDQQGTLTFTASTEEHHQRHESSPVGPLSGDVSIEEFGEVGSINVEPTESDPVSSVKLDVDPSAFRGLEGLLDVSVDGQRVGNIRVTEPERSTNNDTETNTMALGPDSSASSGIGPSITNFGDSDGNSMSDGGISLGLVAAVIAVVVVLRGMM